jgi:hypothetical protein
MLQKKKTETFHEAGSGTVTVRNKTQSHEKQNNIQKTKIQSGRIRSEIPLR